MAAKHYGEFELLDYSESKSSTRFFFGAITALNIAGFITQFGALRNALDGITLGTISRERWVGDSSVLSNLPPLDSLAQVELVWLIHYEDTVQGYDFDVSLATADPSKVVPGTDQADYTDPDIATFITAFETLVHDPVFDSPVTVEHMFLAGRRR